MSVVTLYVTRSFALVLVFCLIFSDCSKLVRDNEISSNDGCKVGNRVYKVGEQWSELGECIQYTCQNGGAFSGLTCALVQIPDNSGCILTDMDYSKNYPACCPRVICPEDKN